MQLREPVDRAGASVDFGIRIALRASRNMKQLAIVGFRRFACTLRPRPIGIVGSCALCLRILGRRRGGLGGLRKVRRHAGNLLIRRKGKAGLLRSFTVPPSLRSISACHMCDPIVVQQFQQESPRVVWLCAILLQCASRHLWGGWYSRATSGALRKSWHCSTEHQSNL